MAKSELTGLELPGISEEQLFLGDAAYLNRGIGIPVGFVVKVSGACLQEDENYSLEKTASNLVTLQQMAQAYKTRILVITGAGKEIDQALKQAGLPNTKVGGIRHTTNENYQVIADVMQGKANDLAALVQCYGGKATPVQGLFLAEDMGEAYGGKTGNATGINIKALQNAGLEAMAIACSLGVGKNGSGYNINADDAAAIAAVMLKPKVYLNVTQTGGVLKDMNDRLSMIPKLTLEEAAKLSSDGMTVKIMSMANILGALPELSIVITSPDNMLHSLFAEGYGTMISVPKKACD